MGDRVLPVLTLSYERLPDPQVKKCFLFCALFPEDESIDQMKLIEYFIDEGFLDELDTRDAQYYRGLAIVHMLRKACLLEVDYYDNIRMHAFIRMHDLIREMALNIRGTAYMAKAGRGLQRIPNGEYWTEDLEKVSLMRGYIEDIPPDMSPNCPKLSTLLLNGSLQLENVQLKDSFFMKLQGLKILNLSRCAIRELPDSLSELVNLRALLLRKCRLLLCIPHLRKLKFLRKLDAKGCRSLVEVQGLEELRNLRYLNLYDTGIERLLEGTLRRMVNLQYLKIAGTVEAEEVIQLKALERLKCNFGNVDDFNKYELIISEWDDLVVLVGGDGVDEEVVCNTRDSPASLFPSLETLEIEGCSKLKYLFGHESRFSLSLGGPAFPRLEYISGTNCGSMKRLVGSELFPHFSNLRSIKVENCNNIRELLSLECLPHLPNLECIMVSGCERIEGIISGGGENHGGSSPLNTPSSSSPSPFSPHFPNLRTIDVGNCNNIRELLSLECLPHLPNLERIMVSDCERIEGIISRRGENHGGSSPLNTPSSSSPSPFSPYSPNRRTIAVRNCNNIRELLSFECLPHFPNLKHSRVCGCERIEEIISGGGENSLFSTLKFETLVLYQLPQLKSITWDALTFIPNALVIGRDCPKLKTIPPCVERLGVVCGCERIEEIISGGGENSQFSTLKFETLVLYQLPQLKSITWDALTFIPNALVIGRDCPKLKTIPPCVERLGVSEFQEEKITGKLSSKHPVLFLTIPIFSLLSQSEDDCSKEIAITSGSCYRLSVCPIFQISNISGFVAVKG
ncbi:hypothetical protein NL676_024310 [Syzygium grande]|nr:hypothetical protein NL676_024310 [Syzygium grande]